MSEPIEAIEAIEAIECPRTGQTTVVAKKSAGLPF